MLACSLHKYLWPSFLLIFLSVSGNLSLADNSLSRYEIKHLLRHKISSIKDLTENPRIIAAVRRHNAKNITLKSIIEVDKQWSSYDDSHPQKKKMYQSIIGLYLKNLVEFEKSIYSEIFLTDNQGANITAWPITSDYWQGDENKWSRAFNSGTGSIYIGQLEYDESSNANAVQISIPVMDDGKAIGVLIAGIKLTYLQAKYLNSTTRNSP